MSDKYLTSVIDLTGPSSITAWVLLFSNVMTIESAWLIALQERIRVVERTVLIIPIRCIIPLLLDLAVLKKTFSKTDVCPARRTTIDYSVRELFVYD